MTQPARIRGDRSPAQVSLRPDDLAENLGQLSVAGTFTAAVASLRLWETVYAGRIVRLRLREDDLPEGSGARAEVSLAAAVAVRDRRRVREAITLIERAVSDAE